MCWQRRLIIWTEGGGFVLVIHVDMDALAPVYLRLDCAGHLEQIYQGETLYKTIEYMRKKRK